MSSIPQGAVGITFVAQRSEIDAYLAELRQGYTIPIRAQYEGPRQSAGVAGSESPSGAAAGGGYALPSLDTSSQQSAVRALRAELVSLREEFQAVNAASRLPSAGTGGRQNRPTLGEEERGAIESVSSLPPDWGAMIHVREARLAKAAAARGPSIPPSAAEDFTANESTYTTLVGAGGGVRPENSAAGDSAEERAVLRERAQRAKRVDNNWDRAQLAEQKAAEMAERKAARAAAGIAEEAEDGGSAGGGGNRILGLRAGRLGQLATAGFIATEALRVIQDKQQYERATYLAGSNQGAKLDAQMAYYDQLTSVPIAGQIAGLIQDPTGEKRTGIDLVRKQTKDNDSLIQLREVRSRLEAQEASKAYVAEGVGVQRARRAAESEYDASTRDNVSRRNAELDLARTPFLDERERTTAKYEKRLKLARGVGSAPDIQAIEAEKATALARISAQEDMATGQVTARYEKDLEPAKRIRDAALRDIQQSVSDQTGRYVLQGDRAGRTTAALLHGGSLYDAERQSRQADTDFEADKIQRDSGANAAQTYRNARKQQADLEDTQHRREVVSTNIALRGGAFAANLRGNNDPFGAQLATIGTEAIRQFQDNPENRGAVISSVMARVRETYQTTQREIFNTTAGLGDERAVLQQRLARNGLGVDLASIDAQRNAQLRSLPSGGLSGFLYAPVRNAIEGNADLRAREARQDNQDSFSQQEARLRARTESLGILTDQSKGTPESRRLAAEANSIERDAQLAAREAFQDKSLTPEQKKARVRDLYALGGGELKALQQNYVNSFRGEEVNPNRTALTGAGTEDPAKSLADIAKALADLSDIPDTLTSMDTKLGNLVAQ